MWGTCLGFQDLVRFGATKPDIGDFTNVHYAEPLEFIVDYHTSILFKDFEVDEITALQSKKIAYLSHHHGFSLEHFSED